MQLAGWDIQCAAKPKYELVQGDVGFDVAALQINLNLWAASQGLTPALNEDGYFGGRTYRRVRTFQRRNGLLIDGRAGPVTQRHLALIFIRSAQDIHNLPVGLLRGIVERESAYQVGAVNCARPDRKDLGWAQISTMNVAPDTEVHDAFSGVVGLEQSAEALRQRKDDYYRDAPSFAKSHEYQWQNAALAHNWPAAADVRAKGEKAFNDWHYSADNTQYSVDDPAQWILDLRVSGVSTARQWVDNYLSHVLGYVTEYSP